MIIYIYIYIYIYMSELSVETVCGFLCIKNLINAEMLTWKK